MSTIVSSIRAEYVRYKALAEQAIAQLSDAELAHEYGQGGNSIATICWHISGNLRSRFTDFLTTDGEKPWRNREEEFDPRQVSRSDLLVQWERGWSTLFDALDSLGDARLADTVTIRGQSLLVHEALHRSVAHTSSHVGQIVLLAKAIRGDHWKTLSIPRGGSEAYNRDPTLERVSSDR